MAHTILAPLRTVAMVLLPVALAAPSCGQVIHCDSDTLTVAQASRQREAVQFQQRVESGAFFRAAIRQSGKPKSCRMKLADVDTTVRYVFNGNASLEAEIDPSIEYSEQRLQLGGTNEKTAVALLKEEEVDSFGHSGCGIRWGHGTRESSETPGAFEVVYRGDVCNCQGRLVTRGASIVELVLTSTC
jgi:hypothetical protein